MKWKIADITIDNQTVLAPMSGITDSAYRRIIKSMDCGLLTTEMISSKAIIHKSKKTKEMLYMTDCEKPISVQLFGSDAEDFKIASQYIYENTNADIIDINMGCPTKKVVNAESGSALLKHPKKIEKIVKTVTKQTPLPVTVKIRSGWTKNTINALKVSKIIEESGASAITIHPRTRSQKYEGTSDWNIIKEVKENTNIPVIGNGDIWTCYDAKNMIETTNCDAIMLARGLLGNPWLITQCVEYLENNKKPTKTPIDTKITIIKKHANLLIQQKGENIAIRKMRNHLSYYVKNLPHNTQIKEKIFKIKTKNDLNNLLEEIRKLENKKT